MCLYLRNLKPPHFALRLLLAVYMVVGIGSAADLSGSVKLSWNSNPETNIAGYRVKYGTASDALTQSTTFDWTTSSTTVSSLETGKTYYFAVQAYNIYGQDGALSDQVSEFIAVPTAPEISIERSPSIVLADGQSGVSVGNVNPGSTGAPQTFIIRNLGTAALTGLAMGIDGTDLSSFSVVTNLPFSSVVSTNGGFESAFTSWTSSGNVRAVTNTAATEGSNIAEFNYSNTEPNGMISQSFTTTPGTTYTLAFDIGVLAYNTNQQSLLASVIGSSSLLSKTVTVTGPGDGSTRWTAQSFTFVANSTTTTLKFSDVSTTTAAIDLRLDHVRVTPPATGNNAITSLEPGASSSFTVAFSPSSIGTKNASIHISSNDADENPFDLAITGSGAGQPEIAIRRATGTDLTDNAASIGFTNPSLGSISTAETLIIQNVGSNSLTGLDLAIDGADIGEFVVDSLETSILAPGDVTTIRVYFRPTSNGTKTAGLHIFSNDGDENPFDIALTGNGLALPEISVEHTRAGDLADADSMVSFDNSGIGTAGSPETFTIHNTGNADLTGILVSIDGPYASEFIVGTPAATTLAPGASTTFQITFEPESSGTRNAAVHITSNDADENPFDIVLVGNGIALPEISIERSNGTSLAGAAAHVGFSGTNLGSSSAAETLTIRNRGTADLTNISLAVNGDHAADFILDGPGVNILAPGESATFNLVFKPTTSGNRAATLHVVSNDANESPFDIALTGYGISLPKIAFQRASGENVANNAGSVNFGNIVLGTSSAAETLILRNTGTANLTNIAVTIDGEQASNFIIDGPAVDSLAPGSSAAVKIIFKPTASGNRNATIHVSSNDPDESPFNIALVGNGIALPEIAVERSNGNDLADGVASISFGGINIGSTSAAEILTIHNTGTANLTGIAISLDGEQSSNFIIDGPATNSLAPGASTTFKLVLKPTASGNLNAAIHIASNDADENPFDISLSGNGIAVPEIAIERSADGTNLADGASNVSFDATNLGSTSAAETFTINNLGTANLTGITISIDGEHASNFIISNPGVNSLTPGSSTTFRVSFKPTAAGYRNATVHVSSNDADENPFDISLTGNGIALPEIAVERSNGTDLADGATSIGFGGVNTGSSSAAEILTIRNTGTANLTGVAITLDGEHAANFIIDGPGISVLTPGSSATFKITFKPTAPGNRSAALHIASNDADEAPFDIALAGIGIAVPEIAVERSNETNLADGASTVSFSAINLGSTSAAETLTIRNPGTANLTGIAITLDGEHSSDFIIDGPGIDSLAPGSSAIVRVFFKPTVPGTRSAAIHITSNDADENPFDITLAGNGIPLPDISVALANGVPFAGSPASVGFESVKVGQSGAARVFSISNTGTAALTSIKLTIGGPQAADFILEPTSASTLAPAAITTFKIVFKPSGPATRSATLHIASNDPDTNPYNIELSGLGVAVPRMAVFRPNGTPFVNNTDSILLGSVNLGSVSTSETFTVRNLGTANLTNLAATIDGIFGPDFIISGLEAATLTPGSGTSFRVSFKPFAAGARSAVLHLTSNDSETGSFNLTLTGTGVAIPIMVVETADGSRLETGAPAQKFDNVTVGSIGTPRVFTVRNIGTAALTGLKIASTTSAFVASVPDAVSIEPGASATFTVSFKPASGGTKTAALRISNAFAPESAFEVALTGDGITIPGIDLFDSEGASLSSGLASGNFGSLDIIGAPRLKTFTIRNTGSAPLTDINIGKDGPHAADFSIVSAGAATVAPGAATTVTVAFKPSTTGARSASLVVRSNAGDKPIILALSGKGLAAPEIDVLQGDKLLKSGDAFINFGGAQSGSRGDSKTFTIANIGSAALERISILKNGLNPTDFTVTALRTDTLGTGTSTTFSVIFKPSDIGIRWGAIHILSNDANEKSFDIVITGKGTNKPSPTKKARKKSHSGNALSPLEVADNAAAQTVKGFVLIDGVKYRTLTITKTPGTTVLSSEIEVSSNLVDWSSGSNHTTVLRDTATTLTVRDNTPVTEENKRHIRIRP
ncbi:choice-of-anchor D domain-containing protein [Luteolibacter sp.]